MGAFIDLTGQRFGRLLVIERAPNRGSFVAWRCRCDCGNEVTVQRAHLRTGHTQSCGCYKQERIMAGATTHGFAARSGHHPLYATWAGIKQRTGDPGSPAYRNYGGRGIKMYERWQNDFTSFLTDVTAEIGERPPNPPGWAVRKPCYSLDRIDNNGNYEPGNLRWATHEGQAYNSRRRRVDLDTPQIIELYEQGLTSYAIAERFGCSPGAIQKRLRKAGILRPGASKPSVVLDAALLRKLYEQGLGSSAIAKQLGCSIPTVPSRLREAGVAIRPVGGPRVQRDVLTMRALRADGLSYQEIADRIGCSPWTVQNRLQE